MARAYNSSATDVVTLGTAFTIASSGTIAMWAKPAFAPGNSIQYYWWDRTVTNDAPSFQRFSDNNFYVGFTNAGNTRVVVADAGLFTSSTWAHWAFTWTSTLQTFYINGVSKGTQAFTFASPGSFAAQIGNGDGGAHSFSGSLADWALWNVPLTATELLGLSVGARPYHVRSSALVNWLPIDGIQSPEPDLGGAANNGTVTNTSLAFGPPMMQFTARWPQFTQLAPAATVFPFQVEMGQTYRQLTVQSY